MSQVYTDFGAKYDIYAGETKTFTTYPIDPSTGQSLDMSNTLTFASAYVDIVEADGTTITLNIPVTIVSRTAGSSSVTWTAGPYTNNSAGNWQAFLKFVNATSNVVLTLKYNFNILESW